MSPETRCRALLAKHHLGTLAAPETRELEDLLKGSPDLAALVGRDLLLDRLLRHALTDDVQSRSLADRVRAGVAERASVGRDRKGSFRGWLTMTAALFLVSIALWATLQGSREDARIAPVVSRSENRKEDRPILGSWECVAPPADGNLPYIRFVEFQAAKVAMYVEFQGREHLGIGRAEYAPGRVTVRGAETTSFAYELKGEDLLLTGPQLGAAVRFRRLAQRPPQLEIQALRLGNPGNLARLHPDAPSGEEARGRVRNELARRAKEIRAVVEEFNRVAIDGPTGTVQLPDLSKLQAEQEAYVIGLIKEVGWIDVRTFGEEASRNAFFLVGGSRDPSVWTALLPLVKDDVLARKLDPETYARMFDRLQVHQGDKQRYGTLQEMNQRREIVIRALDDPARVEEFRKEIGLPPLADQIKALRSRIKVVIEEE